MVLKNVPGAPPPPMALIDRARLLVSESPASAPVPPIPAVPRAAVGDPPTPPTPATLVSATTTTGPLLLLKAASTTCKAPVLPCGVQLGLPPAPTLEGSGSQSQI